jgi:membrane-associated HD superfamily phosphohydrolase
MCSLLAVSVSGVLALVCAVSCVQLAQASAAVLLCLAAACSRAMTLAVSGGSQLALFPSIACALVSEAVFSVWVRAWTAHLVLQAGFRTFSFVSFAHTVWCSASCSAQSGVDLHHALCAQVCWLMLWSMACHAAVWLMRL